RTGAFTCELADLRIVAVHRQRSGGRKLEHGGAPALGDVLELAVAVELIAEQVAQANGLRPQTSRDLRQGRLVDLEEAELRTTRATAISAASGSGRRTAGGRLSKGRWSLGRGNFRRRTTEG